MNILEEIQNCPVEWKELGEVTDTVTSPVKLTKKEYQVSGEIPIVDQGEQFIAGFSDYGKYLKKDEYIIFGDHSEHVKYIDFAFVQGADGLKILKPKSGIKAKYIYYCFCNFYKKEGSYKRHWSKARTTLIPIPQSEEIQEKIVQTLDKFTDYVTELTSELTSRKKQYSYYRDKLLSFEDEVYQVEWKTLGEVARFNYGYTDKAKETGDIRFIRITDIDENGYLKSNDKKYISLTEESRNYLVRHGDLLMARTGATYGKTLFIDTNETSAYASFLIKITPSEKLNSRYYWHFSKSELYWKQANNLVSKAGQPQFNANSLKNVKIPIPSLEIQSRIVQVLDNFDTVCNDLKIGLPKEIELRQKQYEYFRDKLLTFVAEGEYTESRVEEWDNSAILKLLQWVFGPIWVKLGAVAEYSQKRISVTDLTPDTYVGVDNLLQDRKGKTVATFLPEQGSVTTYNQGDILIGNIRPYLKKIWFSNQVGGTSGDVLTIQNSIIPCMENKYLYYILSDDRFFYYNVQYSKGSKMPRGDKQAIMQYKFILPSLTEQKRIVSILDNFNTLTNSLSEGLPKEIELRQKQYEYWREQLLNFTR